MGAENKYLEIRKRIMQLFHMNRNTFSYRKTHMLLHNEGWDDYSIDEFIQEVNGNMQ